jgi:hypothetical protein
MQQTPQPPHAKDDVLGAHAGADGQKAETLDKDVSRAVGREQVLVEHVDAPFLSWCYNYYTLSKLFLQTKKAL